MRVLPHNAKALNKQANSDPVIANRENSFTMRSTSIGDGASR